MVMLQCELGEAKREAARNNRRLNCFQVFALLLVLFVGGVGFLGFDCRRSSGSRSANGYDG